MKIALLMSVASPWSRDIALEVSHAGHEVHLIDATDPKAVSYVGREDGFQQASIQALRKSVAAIHQISYKGAIRRGVVYLGWRLRQILRETGADLLGTLYGGSFALAAYLSGFRPYAVYVVGSDVLVGGRLKKTASRVALSAASTVFSNGRHLAQRTRELAPRARVLPLYIGTDTSRFRPGVRLKSPISILCTRGFLPIYNNELIIRALSHLADNLPEHETVFAAAGPELEQAQSLARRILTPSQWSRVKFLGGADRDRLAELLCRAHVYVSMSLSDGTSLSLMEALASGAFPILSNIPANQEWIDQETNNGFLVPCDNSQELATALTMAINDETLRSAAAEKNRRLILEEADLKANMATMLRELSRNTDIATPVLDMSTESRPQELTNQE